MSKDLTWFQEKKVMCVYYIVPYAVKLIMLLLYYNMLVLFVAHPYSASLWLDRIHSQGLS